MAYFGHDARVVIAEDFVTAVVVEDGWCASEIAGEDGGYRRETFVAVDDTIKDFAGHLHIVYLAISI